MRLIDAEALMKKENYCYYQFNGHTCVGVTVHAINRAPTVDCFKHGRWLDSDNARSAYSTRKCSICAYTIHRHKQRTVDYDWNYCPHCGARMDGGAHRAAD